MAIQEVFKKSTRGEIVFFEEEPPQEALDYLKHYKLRRFNESDLVKPNQLAKVAAVIFRQRHDKLNKIRSYLEKYAETFLLYDCRVFVDILPVEPGSETPKLREFVLTAVKKAKLPVSRQSKEYEVFLFGSATNEAIFTPMVHILSISRWSEVTEYLHDYPPGAPPSTTLKIEVVNGDNDLSQESKILIKRAFHDCQNVKLVGNKDGKSGVSAYRVYAIRKEDYIGNQRPYEYFVKIGDRKKIAKEYSRYRDRALEHIPFHLGPRLRLDRCELGTQQGIIVSDYVSGAEKLLDCARDGRAAPVIASLFNTTLRNWHEASTAENYPLKEYLKERMPVEIPVHRRSLIAGFGSSKMPAELNKLLETMPCGPVQVGAVHGDLHALNVLVRGGDAIVIDFEKVNMKAPLLLDFASIEAGLFVGGFIDDGRDGQELLQSIESLYVSNALVEHQFKPCDPSDGSAWFFDCVRQVRMQAQQIELVKRQYAFTVAVELAKKACKENFNSKTKVSERKLTEDDVRAIAYVLAEKILHNLSNTLAKNCTGCKI